jgi:hypothetical protein
MAARNAVEEQRINFSSYLTFGKPTIVHPVFQSKGASIWMERIKFSKDEAGVSKWMMRFYWRDQGTDQAWRRAREEKSFL